MFRRNFKFTISKKFQDNDIGGICNNDGPIAMDEVLENKKNYTVIKFNVDDTYSTRSKRNKAANSAAYFIGEEVTMQWSKNLSTAFLSIFITITLLCV